MQWSQFESDVRSALVGESGHIDLSVPFEDEHALTEAIALGLRRLFSESFGIPADSNNLCHCVAYRKGKTAEDRRAWKLARKFKWIEIQGRNFVPDVLIRDDMENPKEFLPIEIKLLENEGYSQGLATAIGQSLVYRTKYPHSIAFVGVTPRAVRADGLVDFASDSKYVGDNLLRKTLEAAGVSLVIRQVGM